MYDFFIDRIIRLKSIEELFDPLFEKTSFEDDVVRGPVPTINIKINLLLADLGDNSDFGPERISSQQYLDILTGANAVAVVNWATVPSLINYLNRSVI
jgi:hypothetical protein